MLTICISGVLLMLTDNYAYIKTTDLAPFDNINCFGSALVIFV